MTSTSKIYFALLVLTVVNLTKQDVVDVSVYYESLCPDSVQFIVKQLYPGYQRLKDAIKLKFIPFGFAHSVKENGNWQFICQHGPKECYGNKIQACALGQNSTFAKKTDYIYCIMKRPNPADPDYAEECAEDVGLSWTSINNCTTNGEGDKLLLQYEDLTEAVKPKIQYIPTVIFNNQFNQTLQNDAEFDFINTVCKLFKVEPENCLKQNNSYIWENISDQ